MQETNNNFFCQYIFIFLFWGLVIPPIYALDPNSKLGDEYSKESDVFYQKAVTAYKESKSKPGADVIQISLKLANEYFKHADYQLVIAELTPVYEEHNTYFRIAKLLAMAYFRIGDYANALSIFDRGWRIDDIEFLFYYGQTCEQQNLYPKASEIYQQVLKLGRTRDQKEDRTILNLTRERLRVIESQMKIGTIDSLPEKIQNIIKTAPTQKEYPDAGAIILLNEDEYEIFADLTATRELHSIIKILNERGRHFGEVELNYDSNYEKVEVLYARVIKPDGKVIDVENKHIRDVSLYPEFPLYSDVKTKIISIPEIVENAVIEYRIRWRINKLIDKKHFSLNYNVQDSEPILQSKLSVVIPERYNLKYKSYIPPYSKISVNGEPAKERVKGNKRKHTWEFTKLPGIVSEPMMPSRTEIVPYLSISSFKDWQEINHWWWEIVKTKIVPDGEIRWQVRNIIGNRKDPVFKTQAIYNWIVSKVRYIEIDYGKSGYEPLVVEPHSAAEVIRNKYGDSKDKAILLISMLRQAGIESYPVLIGTKGYWQADDSFPSLVFNHIIVYARVGDKELYLDPTVATCPFGDLPAFDQGRKSLLVRALAGEIVLTYLYPAEQNRLQTKIELSYRYNEGIIGKYEIASKGIFDQNQRAWLKYTKPDLVKESLQNKINTISPGGRLVDYKISNFNDLSDPIKISFEFKGDKFFVDAGNTKLIPRLGGISAGFVNIKERQYPLDFQTLQEQKTTVTIKIPSDLKIKYSPPPVIYDTAWFSYSAQYTSFPNGVIMFEERITDKKTVITTREYPEFKNIYETIARETDKQMVLETVTETESDK